jgi:hypothetical protein
MTPITTTGIGRGGTMSFAGADAHMPDPILTDILREGDPQFSESFGEMVFPSLNVGRPFIRIPVHGGGEQYIRHRTERGPKAKHTEIMDTVSSRTFGWARFGVKAGLDDIDTEFSEAAFRRMEMLLFLLDEALRVDQEVIRQELLAVANWPGGHAINITGSEWDFAGGDSAGDLRAAEAVIKAAHPWVQPEHLELVLTFAAKEAALQDPTYLAARTSINYFQASLEDWTSYAAARYQSVRVGELLVKDDINATETELWGERAVLKIHDAAKRFVDEERGSRIFAREHRFTAGQVSSSWRDEDRTTNWMAVDRQNLQVVHDFTTAVLLYNMVK